MINLGINNLYVEPSTYGWTLAQACLIRKKTGEVEGGFKPLSYHGTLEAAVTEAWRITQRDRIAGMDCIALADAIRIMQQTKDEFVAQLKIVRDTEARDD